jgi:hypothetical protein
MTTIAAAGNVEAPAFLALKSKGFHIERHRDSETWTARKGELEFVGDGPLQLLGLVALHETRGVQWQATDQEIEEFLDACFPGR